MAWVMPQMAAWWHHSTTWPATTNHEVDEARVAVLGLANFEPDAWQIQLARVTQADI
jgi:hypothetical protein